MTKYLMIPEDKYKEIYCGYLKYCALQNGGVDNWEWYGESLGDYLKECYIDNHPDGSMDEFYDMDYDYWDIADEDAKQFSSQYDYMELYKDND